MRRILVLGPCGAGKSTLAKELHRISGLPLYHLDRLYWNPGHVPTPRDEWEARLRELTAKPAWIIDGSYLHSLDIRLERADGVVWLDRSGWTCTWRILKRVLRNNGKVRDDMAEGCPERFDPGFLWYTLRWNRRFRNDLLQKLNRPDRHFRLFMLRSDYQIERFSLEFSGK